MYLIIYIILLNCISGCFNNITRDFPRSKSEYTNISFQYPWRWKLIKEPLGQPVKKELWQLDIPELDSDITIRIRQMTDSQKANEWFGSLITDYFYNLDPDMMDKEEIEVCGKTFQIYKYYQPEVIEDDFIVDEANEIDIPFTYENVYYLFEATVLIPEQSHYNEIEEGFMLIINSIICD